MGKRGKWQTIMDLEVQDPKNRSTFSSKDLAWSEIYGPKKMSIDRIALIPSHRVSEFIQGEEMNPDAPCTFTRRKKKPPNQRASSALRYGVYVFLKCIV